MEGVLVINSETRQQVVEGWKRLTATIFGNPFSIWNTSLYCGLSYNYELPDGGTFISQLAGKLLSFLTILSLNL